MCDFLISMLVAFLLFPLLIIFATGVIVAFVVVLSPFILAGWLINELHKYSENERM